MKFSVGNYHVIANETGIHLLASHALHGLSDEKIEGGITAALSVQEAVFVGNALLEAARQMQRAAEMSPARIAIEKARANKAPSTPPWEPENA